MRRFLLALALGVTCQFAFSNRASAKPRPPVVHGALAAKPPSGSPQELETVLEVSVLHGTHEVKDTDPRIGNVPELSQGPFAKYASYQLLLRSELRLHRGGRRQLKLPNGRELEARLEDILPDGTSRLVASINRPDAKDFLPLLEVKARPGQAFIVAGQTYKRGILVLIFKVLR